MIITTKQPVSSAITHAARSGQNGLEFAYLFSGEGDWVYGHLAKLTLFGAGRQVENLNVDEIPDALNKMAIREQETQEKFWEQIIEHAKTLKVMKKSKYTSDYIVEQSSQPLQGNFPSACIAAAEVALSKNKAATAKDAHALYIKTLFDPIILPLTEEFSEINEHIVNFEYNESKKSLTYWALKGTVVNE